MADHPGARTIEAPSSAATVSYGERWTNIGLYIAGPLDAATARRRHERGQLYAAILGDPERPWAHLDVRLEVGYVGVTFLDEQLRQDLSYTFALPPDAVGDLLLEQAAWRSYDSSGAFTQKLLIFKASGLVYVIETGYAREEQATYELESDLADNWEPVPAFGRYESIARRERWSGGRPGAASRSRAASAGAVAGRRRDGMGSTGPAAMEIPGSEVTVSYGERWANLEGYIVDPLDVETARGRHERGQLYAAILGDPEHPWAHLDVRLEVGYVGVHFLDEQLREHLTYTFSNRHIDTDGDLFLEQATWRSYDPSSGDRVSAEHCSFEPSGLVHVKKIDYAADEQETYDVESDLAENWEPVPAFGRYESIARRER